MHGRYEKPVSMLFINYLVNYLAIKGKDARMIAGVHKGDDYQVRIYGISVQGI